MILTDEAMQVSAITHHAPLGKSDHDVISFDFHCYLDFAKPKQVYSYNKARFQEMKNALQGWPEIFLNSCKDKDVEESWSVFKSKMHELKETFVPKTTISGKPSWCKKGSIPIGRPLQEAIRKKNSAHRKWKSSRKRLGCTFHAEYTTIRKKVKRLMRKAKKAHEKNICLNAKDNPKLFWAHVRQKLKTKAGVAPLLADKSDINSTKFDDKEKANVLQQQFSGVFTREPQGNLPSFRKRTTSILENMAVEEEKVKLLLLSLNVNKSCGPDGIHPRMLIALADLISGPLAFIMKRTLSEGCLPQDWKKANVSPIFKKGAKNLAQNYRPISLTSIVCKIMETMVKEDVLKHVISNGLLSLKQFGFIAGRSTVTQLLRYMDYCAEVLAKGSVTDVIYLDFAKAFDTVPHSRLLLKLKAYGIDGNVLTWIKAFLTGRTQVVQVNGESSSPAPVLSGIPQGSVLGPLLFVIFINDLPESIKSEIFLFADDTKVFRKITSISDSEALQRDIDSLEEWTRKWLLEFNVKKCHILTLGKIEDVKHTHRYTLADKELEHVFSEKDLGVTFDSELQFEEHITSKVNKANAIVGLIRRSFAFLDCHLFKKLYTTFVRPHLEYAQSVWAPHLQKYTDMLEKVQIRATGMVDGLKSLEYPERLKKLELPTLVYRRARGDMIETYKHLHIYDPDSIPQKYFELQRHESRIHNYQLVWKKPSDGVRGSHSNSFYYRIQQPWNDLPREVVDALTVDSFKNELDAAWSTKPFMYDYKATPTTSGS